MRAVKNQSGFSPTKFIVIISQCFATEGSWFFIEELELTMKGKLNKMF